jgi:glutathione S-transferase
MDSTYRLVSIPASHYCEKARWALDRLDVPYQEEGHPPVLHWRAARSAGGGRTVPILVTDLGVMPDSTDILQFLDARHAGDWRPYPQDETARAEVEELEELFDTRLGPHTRRVVYYYLLQYKHHFLQSILAGVGSGERALFKFSLPVMKLLLRKGMNITPSSAERSLEKVREVFATVDERLGDGKKFLVGDAFTAADLTFAALAAPVLLPREYGSVLPPLAELPDDLLAVVEEFRSAPSGEFALRIYRDFR